MEARFESFIRERQFITNVTPSTIELYRRSLKWLPSEFPTLEQLKDTVLRMRERGLKETGANMLIRSINAYLHWTFAGSERKCGAGCDHPRMPRLKEPKTVMPTYTEQQIRRLVAWTPRARRRTERRLHLNVLFLLDTGCRISEALNLRVSDIDMENLLVKLDGKGRKERVVPFSFELRKAIFRYCRDFKRREHDLLFGSRDETYLRRRNISRDVRLLCNKLGFTPPARTVHAFRHTFAVNYLRRGGSVFHLQKVLGHSTLEMTRRYANLVTADLQAVHERVSLLSK
jgi:integrase/recombinase XerD